MFKFYGVTMPYKALRRYIVFIRLKLLGYWRFHNLLNKYGGAYTRREVAAYLHISTSEVMLMKHNNKLLAYSRLNRLYFPIWQFKDNKVLSGFDMLLHKLCDSTATAKIRFFLMFDITLGMTRIEALHNGYNLNQLVEKAESFDIHGGS